jgi:hypothetical protein
MNMKRWPDDCGRAEAITLTMQNAGASKVTTRIDIRDGMCMMVWSFQAEMQGLHSMHITPVPFIGGLQIPMTIPWKLWNNPVIRATPAQTRQSLQKRRIEYG